MSGLIFEGNPIESFGEFLPAPYINKVFVYQDYNKSENLYCKYVVEILLFLQDRQGINLSENGVTKTSLEAHVEHLQGLNYYVMAMTGVPTDVQESLLSRDIDPITFYNEYGSSESNFTDTDVSLYKFNPFANEPSEMYDTDGNTIYIYPTEILSADVTADQIAGYKAEYIDGSYTFTFDFGFENNVEYIICFSSTIDYDSEKDKFLDEYYSSNKELLDIQISDVAYEQVYVDGTGTELANKQNIQFLDSRDQIYDQVPLESIQNTIHKILQITHNQIKMNITNLLGQFENYRDSATDSDLVMVMDTIYTVLEKYANHYDIVPRLNKVKETFPDKTPVKPIGRLYKRFSTQLYNINKSILQGQQLTKKYLYSAKIIDRRTLPTLSDPLASNNDLDKYIYSDKELFTNLLINSSTGRIIAGYFFFDYEKAIRTKSELSKYLDINKMEKWGISLPYDSFIVSSVKVEMPFDRDSLAGASDITAEVSTDLLESQQYPYFNKLQVPTTYDFNYYITPLDDAAYNEDVANSIFYGSEELQNSQEARQNGYITSLVNRSYSYIPFDNFETEKYRLMLLEFLEYHNTESGTRDYNVTVTIQDNTTSQFDAIYTVFNDIYNQYEDYANLVAEKCAYNNNINQFNDYFVEGILQDIPDTVEAIWYTAPAIYSAYSDILFNAYGGDQEVLENATASRVAAISPFSGDAESVAAFLEEMKSFTDYLKSINDELYSSFTYETYDVVFEGTLSFNDPEEKAYAGTNTEEILTTDTGLNTITVPFTVSSAFPDDIRGDLIAITGFEPKSIISVKFTSDALGSVQQDFTNTTMPDTNGEYYDADGVRRYWFDLADEYFYVSGTGEWEITWGY